ncbi:HAD-IA family hydrolase [Priestia taiwanensis]|uniref:Phosphoglycolate phosphatase n=1 Tax=Priestia taiwanensis TaxID=1347902 RepID=A0A917ER31_9BACI|nr:HAD-IA family hydrolase [Priestia taiwanensis]MBM7363215.1 phosphoglycolate phosphatase [Priestia taiwanensis]GGE68600.1 phosphoglycolate phosphatase [Priestia taiwanensis]
MNILWDFDGTIFDTYPVFARIMKQVMEEDISEEYIYAQLKTSFTHAVKHFNLADSHIQRIIARTNETPADHFKPFKGVEDILKSANKNVIMTHSTRAEVMKILCYYGWEHYFVEIVTIDDGFPRKPHVASYEYLHNKHTIDLAIGDRLIDIIPAKELGIKTCLFQNNEEGADYYVDCYEGERWDN